MNRKHEIRIVKATSLFFKKQYLKVIRILEPEILNYRDSFNFYYLLGLSCLYENKLDNADSYLKRAHQIDEDNIIVIQGLAYVLLQQGQFDEALKLYLDIIELDPKNRIAKKGLGFIRKCINLDNNQKKENISKLLPKIKSAGKLKGILLILLTSFILLSVTIFFITFFPREEIRAGIDKYRLPETGPFLTDYSLTYQFELTESEVRKSFNLAKKYFNQYRDNLALVEINRLLNSNAAEDVKNIVSMLKDYVREPDFSNIQDSFSFSDVKKEPVLYQGCFIVWSGKIGSLQVNETFIKFDFWIGDEQIFEGVLPVELDFAYKLSNGQQIEILGEIIYSENILKLKGLMIHELRLKQ